jgi:hypothetical protein
VTLSARAIALQGVGFASESLAVQGLFALPVVMDMGDFETADVGRLPRNWLVVRDARGWLAVRDDRGWLASREARGWLAARDARDWDIGT